MGFSPRGSMGVCRPGWATSPMRTSGSVPTGKVPTGVSTGVPTGSVPRGSVSKGSVSPRCNRDRLPRWIASCATGQVRGRARAKRPILGEQVRPLPGLSPRAETRCLTRQVPSAVAMCTTERCVLRRDVCYGAMCATARCVRNGFSRDAARAGSRLPPGVNVRLHTSSSDRTGRRGGSGGSGAKPQRTRRRHKCGKPGGWRSESRLLADRL